MSKIAEEKSINLDEIIKAQIKQEKDKLRIQQIDLILEEMADLERYGYTAWGVKHKRRMAIRLWIVRHRIGNYLEDYVTPCILTCFMFICPFTAVIFEHHRWPTVLLITCVASGILCSFLSVWIAEGVPQTLETMEGRRRNIESRNRACKK